MNLYVLRDGKQFGPYREEVARRYLRDGSLRATDKARADTNTVWTTLGALLPGEGGQAQAHAGTHHPPEAPPSLHWGLVLFLSIVTLSLFFYVWALVQANWLKKLSGSSKPLVSFSCVMGCIVFSGFASAATDVVNSSGNDVLILQTFAQLLIVAAWVLLLQGTFAARRILQDAYADAPPAGLRMNSAVTFFFTIIALQYALNRVSRYRETGVMPL